MTDLESNEVDVHFESNAFSVSWYLKYFEFLHGTIFCLSFPALITEGIRVILQIELTYQFDEYFATLSTAISKYIAYAYLIRKVTKTAICLSQY